MKKNAFDLVSDKDLSGKVYLITGAYSGLGAITTEALLRAKATVIIAGRNAQTQATFLHTLKQKPDLIFENQQVDIAHTLDLGNLASVRVFAHYIKETYAQVDCLINNAGVMFTPPGKTKDGFDLQFGTNVIGPFLLAKLLVDMTKRQVWLSSKGHTRLGAPRIDLEAITHIDESNYNTTLRYQQSKLGDILLAKYFHEQYPQLNAVSVHPGVVKTNLGRHMTIGKKLSFMLKHPLAVFSMKEPEEGAATQVMVATIPDVQLVGGAYYAECSVAKEAESARNMDDAKKLFEYCDRVTAKFQN